MRTRFATVFLAVALVATSATGAVIAAGTTASGASTGSTVAAKVLPKTPGTLITSKAVAAAGVKGKAFRVEYWSQSFPANKPVKVSGLVIVPPGKAPVAGWPMLSWAHQFNGLVAKCAPSLNPNTDVPMANDLLAKGWEIVASDYLNENAYTPTSKVLHNALGVETARNVIDIVRAARHLTAAHAGTNYAVLGWSEGGNAGVWVSHIAKQYAPKLKLKGVATFAAAVGLPSVAGTQAGPTAWPFLLVTTAVGNAVFGNAVVPLDQILTPTGIGLISTLQMQCFIPAFTFLVSNYKYNQVFLPITSLPASTQQTIDQNDTNKFTAAGAAPILFVQGDKDVIVQPSDTATLAGSFCALSPSQQTERWLYTGLDHLSIIGTATPGTMNPNGNLGQLYSSSKTFGDIIQWLSNRFAGAPWPDPYVPTANGLTSVTQTNSC